MHYVLSHLLKHSDWYRVSRRMIETRGGERLFNYFESLGAALQSVFPHVQWDVEKFPEHKRKRSWATINLHREFLDQIAPKLGVNQVYLSSILHKFWVSLLNLSSTRSLRTGFRLIAKKLRNLEDKISSGTTNRFQRLFNLFIPNCENQSQKHYYTKSLACRKDFGEKKNIKNK